MDNLDFLNISLIDLVDIVLVAILLFSLYRLVKGTVAINIFLGIVIIYMIWKLTDILNMDVLSNILGNFISVGFFALIVVFQQEIRKFLLLVGSSNFTSRKNVLKYFNFLYQKEKTNEIDVKLIIDSCNKMAQEKTGAIIILERNTNLDFVKNTGDITNIQLSPQILETIFFKNGPLHDGGIIIKNNYVTATRVVLPVSENNNSSKRYGLRHRAGIGISEKTDAIAIVISEQTGKISYFKDGDSVKFESSSELNKIISEDLTF
ncbi:MAG: TIGR00159 family protein [Flavobacteriaceae bacterium]|nr:TIGR00159 family protein [Flavobacteriaceae bacterium]